MQRRLLPFAAALAALGASACGDGATGVRTDTLTPAEARAAASQLQAVASTAAGASSTGFYSRSVDPSGPSASAGTVDLPFTRSAPCPRGGSLAVEGRVAVGWDAATRSGTLELSATSTPAACAADNGKGATLTFTGDPNTQVRASGSAANGVPGRLTVTQQGAFKWRRSDGSTGTCTVNLASVADPAAGTLSVTGTFCGASVDVTGPLHG